MQNIRHRQLSVDMYKIAPLEIAGYAAEHNDLELGATIAAETITNFINRDDGVPLLITGFRGHE